MIFFSCKQKSAYPPEPKLTYNSLQPKILKAGSSNGYTLVSLGIVDGDGDIGFNTDNLYFHDSRDSTNQWIKMRIPEIPGDYSPGAGIKGSIEVIYLAAWLLLRPDTAHLHSDTLHWSIFMKDEAGHISDTVETEDLILVD